MLSKEFERHCDPSPENFRTGREVVFSFSSDEKSDKEPEYELSEQGRKRLLEAIRNDFQEHGIYSRKTPDGPKNKKTKPNSWEPFCLEPTPDQRFVNLYGGPFSQYMELNRVNAERLLEVAAIQGRVILTDVPMDRNRGIAGVNADGSVSKRRNLFFGEKLEEDESKAMVRPIPDGWKIEISGQEILDNLSRKESNQQLNKRFVNEINSHMRSALNSIIVREKFSSDRNSLFITKSITSAIPLLMDSIMHPYYRVSWSWESLPLDVFIILSGYTFVNILIIDSDYDNKKAIFDYICPPLEPQRVIRGLLYNNIKGRNLIRLKESISE